MESIKLYYAPKTRSSRPRWLLEEMGVPYDLIRINLGEKQHKSAHYLKVHPLGLVPAIEVAGATLFESTAIVGYLADKFLDKKLAPALASKDRALYWQWMMYGAVTLEVPVMTYFMHTVKLPEAARNAGLAEEAIKTFKANAAVVNDALTGKPFLVGDSFTAADVVVGSTLIFARALKMPMSDYPSLPTYVGRLMERPPYQRSIAD